MTLCIYALATTFQLNLTPLVVVRMCVFKCVSALVHVHIWVHTPRRAHVEAVQHQIILEQDNNDIIYGCIYLGDHFFRDNF